MGALPDRLPGFQHVENDALRAKFDAAWGVPVPPKRGWHLSGMFDAMERGELQALYVIGENPVQSEADQKRAKHLLSTRDFMVVQDIFLTATAELADVVLPAAAAWAESEGTVTNSERRVQLVRKALDPPGEARDDLAIIFDLARRDGPRLGRAVGRDGLERAADPVPGPRRDELRPARGRGRPPVAVLRRDPPRRAVPPLAAVGGPGARATGSRSSRSSTTRRSTSSTRTTRSGSRPVAGSTRTTPASRPAATPRPCGGASRSTSHPRTRSPTSSSTANASGSSRAAAGSRSRSGSTRRSGRVSRS